MPKKNIDLTDQNFQVDMQKLKGFSSFSQPSRYNIRSFIDSFKEKEVTYVSYDGTGSEKLQIRIKRPSLWDRIKGKKPEFILISGKETYVNECLGALKIDTTRLEDRTAEVRRPAENPYMPAETKTKTMQLISYVRRAQTSSPPPPPQKKSSNHGAHKL